MVCLPHMRSTATWPPTPQCRYMDQCSTHHPCHCHCHCQYHQQHHYHHDNHCQCHGHYRHPTLSIEHSTSRIHYASIIDHCHNGMPIGTTMWSSVAYNQPACFSCHREPGSGYDATSCPVPARQTVTVEKACTWDLGRATWNTFTLNQHYANLGIITTSA